MPWGKKVAGLTALAFAAALPAEPDAGIVAAAACANAENRPVHSVRVEGLRVTRAHIVRRELSHRPGKRFSRDGWLQEKRRLEDLDVFARVELACIDSAGSLILEYRFRELPPYLPFLSVVKTDKHGWSAGPGLASLNLLGRDLRLEVHSRFGGTTEFLLSLGSQWLSGLPVAYDVFALRVDSYNPLDDFHEKSWRVGGELLYRLRSPWEAVFAGEIYQVQGDDPMVTLEPGGDFVPRLGTGLVWDTRDRRMHASRGFFQELRWTLNGGPLGGPADFQEGLSDSRVYLPWRAGQVLHASALYRFRTGTMGRDIGFYDDFHVGGANSLRGHPENADRGQNEIILNLENRTVILPRTYFKVWRIDGYLGLEGILGAESAAAWNGAEAWPQGWRHGYFAGLHILLAGVERIRLDLASNFARLDVVLALGIWEKSQAQRLRTR